MTEPTLKCPNCGTDIKLTESLAAPLVESTRRAFEKQLADKDAAAAVRELIREREEAVRRSQETVDQQVADRLRVDRQAIAAEEAKKARAAADADLQKQKAETASLQDALTQNNLKLAEAQKAQAELLIRQRELDDAKREMALTIQKQVQAELAAVRQKAHAEAEESAQLKVNEKDLKLAEKDNTITAMKKQLEDAQRRAEQGSQQLQGEVLELQLEALLRTRFPLDRIEPVPKGEFGGDVLHTVCGPAGLPVGTILWESKRTKNWSDSWLPKLRDDQRTAKAELAILISSILPKSIETFGLIEGIWIADPRYALPLAFVLRQSLLELAAARQAGEGQATKMELVYNYLTGTQFRQRVQAIVEKFDAMREDLNTERKTMTKLWSKREAHITAVLDTTSGLFGDLQGIAGKALQEIEGLHVKMLGE